MIPNQTFAAFPEFANSGTKTKPNDAKYAAGFAPADVLPAEWTNYFWAGSTKGITDLNAGVTSLEAEVNNVLSNRGIEPAADNNAQLLAALQSFKAEAILAAHPVGSLYWTSSTENPAVTFGGGTWTQIKDKFILAAGDTYANGATGGAATVTLTTAQMPSHTHSMSHTHGMNSAGSHTHSTNSQSTSTTGGMSANSTGAFHVLNIAHSTRNGVVRLGSDRGCFSQVSHNNGLTNAYWDNDRLAVSVEGNYVGYWDINMNIAHTHSYSHTHGTDSQGSHSHTTNSQSTTTTGSAGSGNAHENMPPYVTKYCWERTA